MRFSVITSCYNQLEQIKKTREYLNKQTFIDFEWILADDGSSDGTDRWAKRNTDKYVWQHDVGYRLTKILNKAAAVAEGEYLVWIMGDSYPKEDFLEKVSEYITSSMVATGVRVNVKDGGAVSFDWRVSDVDLTGVNCIRVKGKSPWKLMTLNSMIMPRSVYKRMGGIYSGYDEGYGRMDWDMAAWAHYCGYELTWIPQAIIYHEDHEGKKDTVNNVDLFNKRLKEFQDATLC
jgi:glycosyltransferase involved in cell wall biosynthesis